MLQIAIESTDRSATLYVAGPLSLPGLWQVMRACDDLPPHIRTLRLDLKNVRVAQATVPETMSTALRVWREARGGSTRVDLPPGGFGFIESGAPPREAACVVTNPLQCRAGTET